MSRSRSNSQEDAAATEDNNNNNTDGGGRVVTVASLVTCGQRAFAVGSSIQLVTGLLGVVRRKPGTPLVQALLQALKDAGRSGLVTALMAGGARTMVWLLRDKLRASRAAASLSSGVVVALVSLMLERASRRTLALYALVRSAEFAVRAALKEGKWPKALTYKHADVVLMCMSASQILWSYRHALRSLPPPYQKFLQHHGQASPTFNQAVSDWTYGRPANVGAITTYLENNFPHVHLSDVIDTKGEIALCKLSHPGESCSWFASKFFFAGFVRALSVYVPLNVVFSLLFKHTQLRKDPASVLKQMGVSVFWSSVFLGGYCTTAHISQCIVLGKLRSRRSWMQYLTVGSAGLPVILEFKSRRLELALYCWPRALESMWNCMVEWGWIRPIPKFELVLLCAAFGVMMHTFDYYPSSIRHGYRRGLSWLLALDRCPPPQHPHPHPHNQPAHRSSAALEEE